MTRNRVYAALVAGAFAVVSAMGAQSALAADCVNPFDGTTLSPVGDVNGDGFVNVIDAHCSILVSLWQLSGTGTAPVCAASPLSRSDSNCSGTVNITDVTLVINIALGMGLSTAVDPEQDGCANPCQVLGWEPVPLVVPIYAGGASAGGGYTVTPVGTGAPASGSSSGLVGGATVIVAPMSQGDPQELP